MHEPIRRGVADLPPYEVVCVQTDPGAAEDHDHVTAVETWDPDGGRTLWSLVQVVTAIRDGESFCIGPSDDAEAVCLEPAVCPRCPYVTLVVDGPRQRPGPCR